MRNIWCCLRNTKYCCLQSCYLQSSRRRVLLSTLLSNCRLRHNFIAISAAANTVVFFVVWLAYHFEGLVVLRYNKTTRSIAKELLRAAVSINCHFFAIVSSCVDRCIARLPCRRYSRQGEHLAVSKPAPGDGV